MSYRTSTIALGLVIGTGIAAAAFAQSAPEPTMATAYQVTATTGVYRFRRPEAANELGVNGFLLGASHSLPNALNDGNANFPEFHNVYIEPGSYAIYKKTDVFPEGTILFKELQLTLTGRTSGWFADRAFGEGLFPRPFEWRGCDR